MIELKFTVEQLQILDKALQNLPYREAAPIIAHVNKQLAEQQKTKSEEPQEQEES